jgi:Asp-tRNA(Asn)/Glu-tRNA(Gln) amidotransferase A subunit family amidase
LRRAVESEPGGSRTNGYRIGVIREYMDKDLLAVADAESIDIIDRAIADLRRLGATIVDPGAHSGKNGDRRHGYEKGRLRSRAREFAW